MKILELFKGSGSISKYYKATDHEVISLDIKKKYNPTICCDIMKWDYTQYPVKYFDVVWASPECKVFSQLQNTNIGIGRKFKDKQELKQAQDKNSIYIKKTLEIINYFQPMYYFIENPLYSKIWNYVENKEYRDKFIVVDYCYFGFSYKKPTKILTNRPLENKRCSCNVHATRIGITSDHKLHSGQKKDTTRTLERYSIPPLLLEYLLE